MAKKGKIQRNLHKRKLSENYREKRLNLKKEIKRKDITMAERMKLVQKLNDLPRDSSIVRFRNRCLITGRPRGYRRKFKMSRIMVRFKGLLGEIPGMKKSSW